MYTHVRRYNERGKGNNIKKTSHWRCFFREREVGRDKKRGEEGEVQTIRYKMSCKGIPYSMGNIVNDYVTSLYGDRW